MIDQPPGANLPLVDSLRQHPGPFSSIRILGKGQGIWDKRRVRRMVFQQLAALLAELEVIKTYVGNDRRIEFQYCQYFLQQRGMPREAVYLEDGVNSYLPFHPSHGGLRAIADPVLEPLLKKLGYGVWYDRSGAVGCSQWVTSRRLTFPQLLQTNGGPPVEYLPSQNYTEGPANAHLGTLAQTMIGGMALVSGNLLLVPPHSNDLLAQYGSLEAFRAVITPLLAQHRVVRVKYHPNENRPALEGLVQELPRRLPLEMLISQCRFDRIVGDTSAALLGAKWLLPDSNVFSVRNNKPGTAMLFALMEQAGISVVDSFAALNAST